MIGKQNTGGFQFPDDMTQFRVQGVLMTYQIGDTVRIDKPGDRWHGQPGKIEFADGVVYGVRFEPTGGTGEFMRSELHWIGQASVKAKENRPAEMKKFREDDPMYVARKIVRALYYPDNHIDDVYVVWFCAALQNWKALVSTNVRDNCYYEVTTDGDLGRSYVDKYQKMDNIAIVTSDFA